MREITVFGTKDCPDTLRTRRQLEQSGLSYRFIDIDENAEAAEIVRQWQNGGTKIPVLLMGKTRLVQPTKHELESELAHLAA